MKPEQKARQQIDDQLRAAGWTVQSRDAANLGAARGVAVGEFPLTTLGIQALREFRQYVTPDDGRKLGELYNVQLMTSNALDPVSKVASLEQFRAIAEDWGG